MTHHRDDHDSTRAAIGPTSTKAHVDGPVTQRRVIGSELLKFRTLRSTLIVLAAAMSSA